MLERVYFDALVAGAKRRILAARGRATQGGARAVKADAFEHAERVTTRAPNASRKARRAERTRAQKKTGFVREAPNRPFDKAEIEFALLEQRAAMEQARAELADPNHVREYPAVVLAITTKQERERAEAIARAAEEAGTEPTEEGGATS